MKKNLFMIMALAAVFAFSSCNNQKTTDPGEEEAVALTDSIKEQALAIFEAVRADQKTLVESVFKLSDDKKAIPAEYFMPLAAADNAQTMEQKCALLGCYVVDGQTERLVYGTASSAERNAVIAKLAVEANLQSKGEVSDDLSAEDMNAKIQEVSVEDFKAALANDDADNQIIVLAYSIMEATLNNQAVYELQNGLIDDIAITEQYAPIMPMLANFVGLVNLLAPHYASLSNLTPVTDKIGAIINAVDEDSKIVAILDYNRTIREMRGKLNVAVNAD